MHARKKKSDGQGGEIKPEQYQNIINSALENDYFDELWKLCRLSPNILLDYRDSRNNNNIFQQALHKNALSCLSKLLTRFPYHGNARDEKGNSLLHLAVLSQQSNRMLSKILYCLNIDYELENDLNNEGVSVLDTAQKLRDGRILQTIVDYQDPRTLTILPGGLTKTFHLIEPNQSGLLSSLVQTKPIISMKGLALMLHYYKRKNPRGAEAFICQFSTCKSGAPALAKIFDLFVRSDTEELLVLAAGKAHKNIYKCEKEGEKVYIIALDSNACWSDGHFLIPEMKAHYPASLARITLCTNGTVQQTDNINCHYYALKNISMLMKTPHFYQELSEGNYFPQPGKLLIEEVAVSQFILPARFMHLATSPSKLKEYAENYPEEAAKIIRQTKQNIPQALLAYNLHERDRFGVRTPQIVENEDFNPEDKEVKEEQFIKKSASITYFGNKMLKSSIPALCRDYDENELIRLISFYDARNLMLDADNQISNKAVQRSLLEGRETTFTYRPRPQSALSPRRVISRERVRVGLFEHAYSQGEEEAELGAKTKQEVSAVLNEQKKW